MGEPLNDRGDRRDSARLRAVDDAAVISDYLAGATVKTICGEHRIGLARLYRILDDAGVERREPNHAQRLPDDVIAAVASAYQAGDKTREIADRFGVSTSSVSNIGRRHYRQRMRVRSHDELVALAVAWFAGHHLTEGERDALTRVGIRTRRHGFAALDSVDPELGAGIRDGLIAALRRRWPDPPP